MTMQRKAEIETELETLASLYRRRRPKCGATDDAFNLGAITALVWVLGVVSDPPSERKTSRLRVSAS